MPMSIEAIDPFMLGSYENEIGRIYQQAFYTPDEARSEFVEHALRRHREYPGFRGHLAFDGTRLIGFVYGYHSAAGAWWHDRVYPALDNSGQAWWLDDAFEFVELAVDPAYQGQGIGGQLHDALLTSLTEQTALLSTGSEKSNAHHLYTSRGWQLLVPNFRFQREGGASWIMGLDLATRRSERT